MDTATAFFPWYSFLGEQLRAGHIPAWNPHEFAGAPFAADPESGWMYLPAMVAFTLLPLDTAVRASLLFHVLLAGLSTYALSRVLGFNVFGGLVAATIYAHSGFFEGHNVCCYAYADVAAWLPLSLLGTEMAVRSTAWRPRLTYWALAGLAMSQILAAWIGQGAYYAALVLGSYLACRALAAARSPRGRVGSLLLNGVGIAALSFGLAAAGLLPRLEFNAVSNLPGGYPDADVSLRATTWNDWGVIANWDHLLLHPGFEYIGWPALLLALAAIPLISRRRHGALVYFAALGLAVLVLARAEPTPLHALFSYLPGFEHIHARSPERAIIVFYLCPAILAAASVTWLTRALGQWRVAALAVGAAAVAIVSADLHAAWSSQAAESLAGGGDYQFARVDLADYFAATPAAQFMLDQSKTSPAFRYFGYAGHVFGGPMPYTLRWADPSITALQVDNRALLTGLSDIEGYNPVHVARYDAFVEVVNGHSQNYHHTDIFDSGIDSPLLDALNVRYVLMPAVPASDEVAPRFSRPLTPVYADQTVQIFENPKALPRAWLVHAAELVAPGEAAVALNGTDLKEVALLEAAPPPLAQPTDPSQETVRVVGSDADRVEMHATVTAPALVVASEVAYPAWHAYVDGQPATLFVADGALRAVAVPTGEHTIELRFESTALDAGLLVTAVTGLLIACLAILHITSKARSRDGSGEVRCKTGAVPQL
jgi:hypothetical protein